MKTRFLPDYIRILLIASTYFVASAASQHFSQAGNNYAVSFATIIVLGEYIMMLKFLLSSIFGFCLGFGMFRLLHTSNIRASRIDFENRDIMEREENQLGEGAGSMSELQEEKSRIK